MKNNRITFLLKSQLVIGLLILTTVTTSWSQAPIPVGAETLVNTFITSNQSKPASSMDDNGNFVVVWEGAGQDNSGFRSVYMQRFNNSGIPQGLEIRVNTYTTSSQETPAVAMNKNGDFVVTWMSFDQDGDSWGIYMQQFNSIGVPQGNETRVTTTTTGLQVNPEVGIDDNGNFIIVWRDEGLGHNIYMQRYNHLGIPQGGETKVNTTTTNIQGLADIAMDKDGNFVITWSSNADGNFDTYLQRFNNLGIPQGGEVLVNTTTNSDQSASKIAMDKEGNFTITWWSNLQDGSEGGIYMQRFDRLGIAQGVETLVNTETNGEQGWPEIAMDSDGDFAIIWQFTNMNGWGRGIYVQRYNSLGIPQGGEIQANTFTGTVQFATISMSSSGDFIIAWESGAQDSPTSFGVYMQRYNVDACEQNQIFLTGTINSREYEAITQIESDGVIASGTIVTFQAGNCITLLPGFHANGEFLATIGSCTSPSPLVAPLPNLKVTANASTGIFLQASPNPFTIATTIDYHLPSDGTVNLYLTNVYGQKLQTLANQQYHAKGAHQINLQTKASPKGLYFLVLEQGAYQKTQKLYLH